MVSFVLVIVLLVDDKPFSTMMLEGFETSRLCVEALDRVEERLTVRFVAPAMQFRVWSTCIKMTKGQ